MTGTPRISVILPVYNVAQHVAACLSSLQAQNFADFEVIVIDDGSTDGSGTIAAGFCADDKRFRLIQQDNRGLSAARNAGLDAARGSLIAFVDGDDRVMPDYLAQLLAALEESGADWVACAIRSVFPDGRGFTHSALHDAPDLREHKLARRMPLATWTDAIRHFPSAWNKLYRRSLIDGLRFDEGTWFEDHAFFLRAAARTDHILHLPQSLYLQTRGRAGQITGADDERVFQQFEVLRQLRRILEEAPRPEARAAFARLASRLICERSTALRDPVRRSHFANTAAEFLASEGLHYAAVPAEGTTRAWGLELAGELPLSLVLPWDGRDRQALADSLSALADQPGPGFEILIVCDRAEDIRAATELAREYPAARILRQKRHGHGPALAHGLTHAKGRYVMFLAAGDAPAPVALSSVTEHMLANRADLGLIGFRRGAGPAEPVFVDHRAPPEDTAPLTPEAALALGPDIGARIFRRDFLTANVPGFQDAPRPGWAPNLGAALLARRVTVLAWPAMRLAPIRHASLRGLLRRVTLGHDALIQALPPSITGNLPDGWQRRLFARALRTELGRAAQPGPAASAVLAAGVAVAASRRGLTRPGPAGFDPSVGPRLARMLTPLAAPGRALPLSSPPLSNGSSIPKFPFPCNGDGLLRFRATFHDHDYANISMTGSGPHPTPFHLSLRRKEGLAACNDRRADGVWRAERLAPVSLSKAGVEVAIRIAAPQVSVFIDGNEVFRLSRRTPLHRAGLCGLDRITGLGIEGGVQLIDMLPQLPGPRLELDPRLRLGAALPEGQTPETVRLIAEDISLPLTPVPIPDAVPVLHAMLPGWIWQDLPPGAALELRLCADGRPLIPAMHLDRDGMGRAIAAVLAQDPAPADTGLALTLLEHLAEPAIWDALPATAREKAYGLARTFGLSDRLPAGKPPALPVPDADLGAIDVALIRFAESQRRNPAPDPLAVLDDLRLHGPGAQQGLMLALSEHFCRIGQDTESFAARASNLPPFALSGNDWTNSAILPFLWRAGRFDEALEALQGLVSPGKQWIQTPPVAWIARAALTDKDCPTAARHAILAVFLDFLRQHGKDYWDRAHCIELTATTAQLIAAHFRLPAELAGDLEETSLKVYGLSRQFWTNLTQTSDLPGRLAQAQTRFAELSRAIDTGNHAAIDDALSHFEELGAFEAERLRIELLGPAGLPLPPGEGPAVSALLKRSDPGLAAMRHMAFPGDRPVTSEVTSLVAARMPDLYPYIDRAPHFPRQQELALAGEAFLRSPNTKTATTLITAAAELTGPASNDLGPRVLAALAEECPGPAGKRLDDWLTSLPNPPVAARELPAGNTGLPAPSPLYDALVVVLSCRPYLTSRIPALRDGWLGLLDELGVPYIIAVGGGDGRREGDVVYLDAPDDYEGLPQKTLAAIAWVQRNTRFGHMLKIDDDCFLNAPLFFRSLAYRKHDYYGRKLIRKVGSTDRIWHQQKSSGQHGQKGFDRSPEPSTYADGGSGYTLSRRAMEAALDAAASPEGQRLIQVSFMEDKMLGDLLTLRGIAVSDEDYLVTVRRRSHSHAIPVPAWQNGFLPSPAAPVMLAHLDTHEDQGNVLALLESPNLTPRKIWPSFQPPRLGYQSNALELISDTASVTRAAEADVAVVAVMRNEMFMLPHFLSHYRQLGVGAFLIADNGSDDGTLEYLAAQPDVALFSVDTDYKRSHYGVAWQQALMSQFRAGKWSLVADADELLLWQREQSQTLPDLLSDPELAQAEAVRIFMLDMYPQGSLETADFSTGNPFAQAGFAEREPFLAQTLAMGPFSDAPCWTSALRHRLIPGARANLFVAQKLALLRYHPWMRLSAGLHFVGDARIARRELIFAHFKYNADFRRKAQAEVARGQHFNDAEEYRKYLSLISEGQSVIHDPALSVPWYESPFVKRRLDS